MYRDAWFWFMAVILVANIILELGDAVMKKRWGGILSVLAILFLSLVIGMDINESAKLGEPFTTINPGHYNVVSVTQISKDEQPYYHLLLEEEGAVHFYTLPSDIVIVSADCAPKTFEVIEKAGLTTATLCTAR